MEGDHIGHQFVKSDVSIQLTSCCAAAVLNAKEDTIHNDEQKKITSKRNQNKNK